jgi:hypothetical protein
MDFLHCSKLNVPLWELDQSFGLALSTPKHILPTHYTLTLLEEWNTDLSSLGEFGLLMTMLVGSPTDIQNLRRASNLNGKAEQTGSKRRTRPLQWVISKIVQ